jgi:pilus assembly protein FimV
MMKPLLVNLRKKMFLSALVSMSACSTVFAIDLGDMDVRSEPGESLNAVIPVVDADASAEDIEVGLADDDEFSKAVVAITPEVDSLEFVKVQTKEGKVRIRITSKAPLDDEVVHFLIAVRTPDARVVREYVVIQEDDVYATYAQPTVIEVSSEQAEAELPLPFIALSEAEVREEREEREEASEEADEDENREEDNEEDELEEQPTSILVAEQKPVKAPAVITQTHYRVHEGDNLSYIAQKVQRNIPNASFNQVLAALYQLNPNAFINGNVNLLRSGANLKLPNAALLAELDLSASSQQVQAQMAAYSKQPVISTASAEAPSEASSEIKPAESNVQGKPAALKILTPETSEEKKTSSTVTGAMTDQQISENLALINEELAQVHHNNENVLERIQALQTQIATLQELLRARESEQKLVSGGLSENILEQPKENIIETPIDTSGETPAETSGTETIAPASIDEILNPSNPSTENNQPQAETPVENIQPATENKAPELVVPSIPALEMAGMEKTHPSFWQQLTQLQWLNYLILAVLVIGAILALMMLSRRRKTTTTIMETRETPAEQARESMVSTPEYQSAQTPVEQVESEDGDKVGAKLELAKAYFDLGDSDGAVALLQEVLWEGNAEQRKTAQDWLDKIDAEKKA